MNKCISFMTVLFFVNHMLGAMPFPKSPKSCRPPGGIQLQPNLEPSAPPLEEIEGAFQSGQSNAQPSAPFLCEIEGEAPVAPAVARNLASPRDQKAKKEESSDALFLASSGSSPIGLPGDSNQINRAIAGAQAAAVHGSLAPMSFAAKKAAGLEMTEAGKEKIITINEALGEFFSPQDRELLLTGVARIAEIQHKNSLALGPSGIKINQEKIRKDFPQMPECVISYVSKMDSEYERDYTLNLCAVAFPFLKDGEVWLERIRRAYPLLSSIDVQVQASLIIKRMIIVRFKESWERWTKKNGQEPKCLVVRDFCYLDCDTDHANQCGNGCPVATYYPRMLALWEQSMSA